jgi:GNAT superfamily N-acetyltransferase
MVPTRMVPSRTTCGWFRRLWHGDEEALLAHYRRLSPADLRLRFLHAVSDEFLADQARKLRGAGYHVTGWFRDGVLRGVAEVAIDSPSPRGRAAEASFSVEAAWRNLGVGHGLMRRALRRARQAGCRSLTVLTAWDNAAMIRLAREFGATISSRDGEVVGELTPSRASWAELSFELADDRIGLLGAASDVLWSIAAANPWRALGRRTEPV